MEWWPCQHYIDKQMHRESHINEMDIKSVIYNTCTTINILHVLLLLFILCTETITHTVIIVRLIGIQSRACCCGALSRNVVACPAKGNSDIAMSPFPFALPQKSARMLTNV